VEVVQAVEEGQVQVAQGGHAQVAGHVGEERVGLGLILQQAQVELLRAAGAPSRGSRCGVPQTSAGPPCPRAATSREEGGVRRGSEEVHK